VPVRQTFNVLEFKGGVRELDVNGIKAKIDKKRGGCLARPPFCRCTNVRFPGYLK
jgi:hypothetical protein